MKLGFFISRKLTKRDLIRFGIKRFKSKAVVFDLSDLLNHRSNLFQKSKPNLRNYFLIKNINDLRFYIKKKNIKFGIDFLENSISEFLIRFVLVFYNIKLIKYLVGLKPISKYKKNIRKINSFNFKSIIIIYTLKFIVSKLYSIIVITGKNFNNYKSLIRKNTKIIYTHSLDYNNYLDHKKKKKIKKSCYFCRPKFNFPPRFLY